MLWVWHPTFFYILGWRECHLHRYIFAIYYMCSNLGTLPFFIDSAVSSNHPVDSETQGSPLMILDYIRPSSCQFNSSQVLSWSLTYPITNQPSSHTERRKEGMLFWTSIIHGRHFPHTKWCNFRQKNSGFCNPKIVFQQYWRQPIICSTPSKLEQILWDPLELFWCSRDESNPAKKTLLI